MTVEVNEFDLKLATDFIADNWTRFIAHCSEQAKADGMNSESFAERVYTELGGEV